MLQMLDLSHNHIAQVPIEWGNLTEKKLQACARLPLRHMRPRSTRTDVLRTSQAVRLAGNPLADPRIRRFVEQDQPSMVKDFLNHVRKNGFKGEESTPFTLACARPSVRLYR